MSSTFSKRKNDRGQMRREDYEAEENSNEQDNGDQGVAGGHFQVASQATLAKRRIIRRSTGGASGGSMGNRASSSGASLAAQPNNAADSATTTTTSTPSSLFAPSSSSSPAGGGGLFGAVNLAPSSSKTLTTATTSAASGSDSGGAGGLFGGLNLIPNKSSTSTPSFSFNSSSAGTRSKPTTAAAATSFSVGNIGTTTGSSTNTDTKTTEQLQKEIIARQALREYALIRFPYSGKALWTIFSTLPKRKIGYDPENLPPREDAAASKPTQSLSTTTTGTLMPAAAPSSSTTGATNGTTTTEGPTSLFSSSSSTKPFSFGTGTTTTKENAELNPPTGGGDDQTKKPTTPFKGFSFGGENNLFSMKSSNPSQSKPSMFSFTAPAATQAPSTSTANSSTNNKEGDDDGDGFPKEEREQVLKAENKDETMLLEIRAKLIEKKDNDYKSYGVGTVQLMQHKINKKQHRIIVRDQIGKIYLNMRIVANMTFLKSKQKTKKGKVQGQIQFFGLAAESTNDTPGVYILRVDGTQVDELHQQLVTMTANS